MPEDFVPQSPDPQSDYVPFQNMCLRPGDRIQLHAPGHADKRRYAAHTIGYVDDVSVLISEPMHRELHGPFRAGDIVIVQAFLHNCVYAFRSTIELISRQPFPHLYLSFPERVEAVMIRKSTRVSTHIAATVAPNAGNGSAPSATAHIDNLSATGALLNSADPLGSVGDEVRLSFDIEIDDFKAQCAAKARIVSTNRVMGSYRQGVEFTELAPNERLMLQSLVYRQVAEHPESET